MTIRQAKNADIPGVLFLLQQVLEVHADLRPDIFIHGTTKYTDKDLKKVFADKNTPVFVAVNEQEQVQGYAFCIIKKFSQPNVYPISTLYVDDLCVEETLRGQHIGRALFEHVKEFGFSIGCHSVTLNVWTGNDTARRFYENLGMFPRSTTMEYLL